MSATRTPRLAFISNALIPPPDEGIRRFAWALSTAMEERGVPVVGIAEDAPSLTRKLLLGPQGSGALRKLGPAVVVYLPSQPPTMGTYLRCAVLRLRTRAKILLVECQSGTAPKGERLWGRILGPHLMLTPSPDLARRAEAAGIKSGFVPMGIDPERFSPADAGERSRIRNDLSIPDGGKPVVLHVGHLRRSRNLRWLIELHRRLDVTTVMVAGTSRGVDEGIEDELRAEGIVVLTSYIENIGDVYRAADLYVFPVLADKGSIAVPLSVLEAMACDIPVVTTSFGGLRQMFAEGGGLRYADDQETWMAQAERALGAGRTEVRTRAMVQDYSWDTVAQAIVEKAARLA